VAGSVAYVTDAHKWVIHGERVLLMRRHRFIVDRWVWELPGGYVDDGEGSGAAAAREVEEETGWRRDVGSRMQDAHQVAYVADAAGRGKAGGQVQCLPPDSRRLHWLVLAGVGGGESSHGIAGGKSA
jgi:8-oxo-dGTP pyrophosphatase MutT (NUDIX family)